MLYVALAETVVIVVIVAAFAGLLRSERRSTARERDLILNQLLHLSGRPWQPAPSDTWTPPPVPVDGDLEKWPVWAGADEQGPVY